MNKKIILLCIAGLGLLAIATAPKYKALSIGGYSYPIPGIEMPCARGENIIIYTDFKSY